MIAIKGKKRQSRQFNINQFIIIVNKKALFLWKRTQRGIRKIQMPSFLKSRRNSTERIWNSLSVTSSGAKRHSRRSSHWNDTTRSTTRKSRSRAGIVRSISTCRSTWRSTSILTPARSLTRVRIAQWNSDSEANFPTTRGPCTVTRLTLARQKRKWRSSWSECKITRESKEQACICTKVKFQWWVICRVENHSMRKTWRLHRYQWTSSRWDRSSEATKTACSQCTWCIRRLNRKCPRDNKCKEVLSNNSCRAGISTKLVQTCIRLLPLLQISH